MITDFFRWFWRLIHTPNALEDYIVCNALVFIFCFAKITYNLDLCAAKRVTVLALSLFGPFEMPVSERLWKILLLTNLSSQRISNGSLTDCIMPCFMHPKSFM